MSKVLKSLFNGRMLCVFFYGISSGLPLLLIGSTLKTWMKDQNVDLTIIGVFALTGLPYTLKFLWSPLMDRYVPPFLGRRRGWILICQVSLTFFLAIMACINPSTSAVTLAVICFIIAFLSASQDIAIDAYRRDILSDEELGLGSSFAVNGYRIGLLVSGAFALALADYISWQMVYFLMSAIMAIGILITFLSPEPTIASNHPKNLREALILPLTEYFNRNHAIEILIFILVFKIGDSMASDMFNPFFLDIGFTKTQIAAVAKVFGLWATIIGGLVGGLAMIRFGISKSLWIFGISQTVSTFGFSILANIGNNVFGLTTVVVFENLCTGMATSAYVGFMSSLCDKRFTATQYALLSSLMGIPRVIFGSSSGFFAKTFGWHGYFLFCTLLHIPGLLLLLRQKRWSTTIMI